LKGLTLPIDAWGQTFVLSDVAG